MELKPSKWFISYFWYKLLIVPYGIETPYRYIWANQTQPFNRTLWN